MGRPLIATDVPGCREVVDDGVNGLLCKPQSMESLTRVLEAFAQLPQESRAAMGRAARHKAEEQFSDQIIARCYLKELGKADPWSRPEAMRQLSRGR